MSILEHRMPRLIALISVSALAGCSSHPTQGSSGAAGSGRPAGSAGSASPAAAAAPAPASTREQVQRWAPAGSKIEPAELKVPGLELFVVSEARPAAEDEGLPGTLVGVAGGTGGKILDGRELVKAAIDGKPDARTLARVALRVAGDDGDVLERPERPEHRKARVGPPAVARGALTFWVWTTDVPRMLEHGALDLASGALKLEPAPLPHAVAISNAMTTLGSVAVSRHVHAIRTLAESCSDPRARQALLAALASHPRARTRAAIAGEAHRCGAAAVDALISAMERDRSAVVRSEAARALGRIGDARARPALAKAVRGEDANLAWAAGNALRKLN